MERRPSAASSSLGVDPMTTWKKSLFSPQGILLVALLGLAVSLWAWPQSRALIRQRAQWLATEAAAEPTLQELNLLQQELQAVQTTLRATENVPVDQLVATLPLPEDQRRMQHLMTPEQVHPGLVAEQYRLNAGPLTKDQVIEIIHSIDRHAPHWKVVAMNLRLRADGSGQLDADLTLQQLSIF
jgi:hypothetical protein